MLYPRHLRRRQTLKSRRYMQGKKKGKLGNGYGYGYSSDLNNWPILGLLPSEFTSQIHMIMPLHYYAVFIVTKDKMVYALGADCNVIPQIGDQLIKIGGYQLIKIDQLCEKNIYFYYDQEDVIFVRTEEGEVYAWGSDERGRSGFEHCEIVSMPTKVPRLNEEHIKEMVLAYDHSIALTKDGKVYNWGTPKYEDLFCWFEKGLPWQVELDSDSEKIIHVSCGLEFNMALTKNGNVYSWGKNNCGSLGLYDCNEGTVRTHPSIITSLIDPVIVKVVCGKLHTLALTATGELYVWGDNEWRQLGHETEDDHIKIPSKLNVPEMGKIVDIFAREDLSAAIDEKQHIYIWGCFYDIVVPVPTFIRLSNMYNIFKHAIPYIIHKPQVNHNEDKSELQELIFNDPDRIMSKPQGRKTVVTKSTSNRTEEHVTPSSSTKEANTQEQEVNNLLTGILDRNLQGELLLGNGYVYGYSLNLNNWPILSLLPSEFTSQIHMIMPLHQRAVFIVTKDKTVYAWGTDSNMLDTYIKNWRPYQTIKKVEELCGKNLMFYYNPNVIFALTEEGEVYAWGDNKEGRLGIESHEKILTPTKVPRLSKEHIIEMALIYDHSIALTKDGKIYNWGSFEYENLFNRFEEGLPWQVEFDSDSEEIIHVSCGRKFNMALTKNGNVYSWGKNKYGSLGLYDCNEGTVRTRPSIITSLIDPVIVKVVCGEAHTLALTATGELYVWGNNEWRQLGYETEDDHITIPIKLNVPEIGKIVDIFACEDLSAAIDEKQHWYIWGCFYDMVVPVPTFIRLSNMYNIFECTIPYIIHKPEINHIEDKSELQELIFNDSSTSDITIEVDGKVFYAHKKILIRSQHFINLLTYKMLKKNRIIVHDKYSYNVYEAFFKYIYTGKIDVSSEEALELLKFADAFNETDLKNDCFEVIQEDINLFNIFFILKEAICYDLEELVEYCIAFFFVEAINMVQNIVQNFKTKYCKFLM